jgi:hypothetical protein
MPKCSIVNLAHVTLGFLRGECNTDVATIYFDAVGAVHGGLKNCYKSARIKKHFPQASDYLCAAGFLECHKAEAAVPSGVLTVRWDKGIGYSPVPLGQN